MSSPHPNDCIQSNYEYRKTRGNQNDIILSKNGWDCNNVVISIIDSFHIKITWCNANNENNIYVPELWPSNIKLVKNKHEKVVGVYQNTLIIDYLSTLAGDYGIISAPPDSTMCLSSEKLLKKDSCLVNEVDVSDLIPSGLSNVRWIHLKSNWGDILKKIEPLQVQRKR